MGGKDDKGGKYRFKAIILLPDIYIASYRRYCGNDFAYVCAAPHPVKLYIWIQECTGCTPPSGVIYLDTEVHRMHLT